MGTILNGYLRGWFFDPARPGVRETIELVVDGEVIATAAADRFRPDLASKQIGDGHHGFVFKLPQYLYDGRAHFVGTRAAGTDAFIRRPLPDVVLDEKDYPNFRASVTAIERGIVTGLCVNESDPDGPPATVNVVVGGRIVRRIIVGGDGAPSPHAFSFAVADVVGDVLNDEITLEVAATEQAVEAGVEHIGRASAWIDIRRVGRQFVEGEVVLPGTRNPATTIELLSGDRTVDVLSTPTIDEGLTRYAFAVPLPDGQRGGLGSLRAVESTTRREIGAEVDVAPPAGANLIANPAFHDWADNRPAHWQLADAVTALPGEGADGTGIRFDSGDSVGVDRLALASQAISLDTLDPTTRRLDIAVDHHAADFVTLEATLTLRAADGEDLVLTTELSAPAGHSSRLSRIVLPAPLSAYRSPATLDLALTGVIPASYGLLRIGLGVPGFSLEDDQDALPEWATVNAVRQGDFASWTGPLRQVGTQRRQVFADGWAYVAKGPNPGVSFWLDRIEARDPAKGIAARDVYAVSARGPIDAGLVRFDADLDISVLFRRAPDELTFYAAAQVDSQIEEIAVIVREESAADPTIFTETKLTPLARRLPLRASGRFEQIAISEDRGVLIHEAAQAALRNPRSSLVLSFTFSKTVDCSLGEISLARGRRETASVAPGYIGFEDPRIAGQLAHLRMVSKWNAPTAIAPTRPLAAETPAVVWRRPDRDFPSVDIVVCVYNAPDEVSACLASIVANTTVPYTLTIIDDGSEVATRSMLERFADGKPWVRLTSNPENLGYTRSANLGMAGSDAAWLVLLNSDTIVTPGWMEGMLDCALSDPAIAFVGPVSNAATWQSVPEVKDSAGGWKVNVLPDGMEPADVARIVRDNSTRERPSVPLLNGFCTLMKTSVLEGIGYLDERSFPMGYGEESDLCLRVQEAGYKLVIADDVYVYHSKSASFGSERRRELSRAGNEALKAKHPTANFGALQGELGETVPLIQLRKALRRVISEN